MTKIKADPRKLFGRKVKRLRKDGIIPANVFGNKVKSQAVQISQKDFHTVYQEAGETSLVDLSFEGKTNPVLIKNVQINPVTEEPLHVDFHQVDLTQTVTANIPVEIIGESLAVKEEGGVLETPLSEIEVEALPADLPDQIEVDIAQITQLGQSLSASDLKLPSKVTLLTDPDTVIVIVSEPKEEEVEEETPETTEGEEGVEETSESPEESSGESSDEKTEDKAEEAID